MFDMFTSRNVKKIFKYPLSRPTTFWEEYVRPESMIVDTLGVYCSLPVFKKKKKKKIPLPTDP